jgi:antitoxin (DNA-binding transcriptional repressor) of toxin-antitoxin stability system
MQMLSVEQAEGHLSEIIDNLSPGEEIVLTQNDKTGCEIDRHIGRVPAPAFRSR